MDDLGYPTLKDFMCESKNIPVRYVTNRINKNTQICDILYCGYGKECPCENCFEEDYHEENYADPPSSRKRNEWCRRNVWKQLYKQHNEERDAYINLL